MCGVWSLGFRVSKCGSGIQRSGIPPAYLLKAGIQAGAEGGTGGHQEMKGTGERETPAKGHQRVQEIILKSGVPPAYLLKSGIQAGAEPSVGSVSARDLIWGHRRGEGMYVLAAPVGPAGAAPVGGPSPMAAATSAPPAAAAAFAPEGSMGRSVPGFSRRSTMYSLRTARAQHERRKPLKHDTVVVLDKGASPAGLQCTPSVPQAHSMRLQSVKQLSWTRAFYSNATVYSRRIVSAQNEP